MNISISFYLIILLLVCHAINTMRIVQRDIAVPELKLVSSIWQQK